MSISLRQSTVIIALILWVIPLQAVGQQQVNLPDSTNIVISRVQFEGNDHVNDLTLENLIRTHTNTTLFGIPGLKPFYGIYQLTGGAFGEEPVYLDYQTVGTDIDRIERYYESIGYFYTKVDTTIAIDSKKARVTYRIDEGERSFISTVAYSGLPDSAFKSDKAKLKFLENSSLTQKQVNDTTFQVKQPYTVKKLVNERDRIISHLKNKGYAAVTSDSIRALIKPEPENKHKLHVLLYIKPGKIYHFGDLHIRLVGPTVDSTVTYPLKKVVSGKPYTAPGSKIYMQKQPSAQTDWELLTDQLLFKPGNRYNYERYLSTINEFQNLSMMTIRHFGYTQSGRAPDFENDSIPVYIYLQTLPKHSVSFNVYGLHRYGFGSGAGITYTNNNLFGGAENLQISLNGSFEYYKDASVELAGIDKTFERYEIRADYYLPKLTFPFSTLNDNLFFANSRTRYSLSFSKADQVLFDINLNIQFNLRYEVHHNDRYTSYLDLLDLQILDTHPTKAFEQSIEEAFGDNPVITDRILEDFRPQISSVLRYTFRSENTDLIKRNYGHIAEFTVAAGGNIPYLVDRFIDTPGTIEGSLHSPVKFSENRLAYSRYVKLTADYRRYIPLSPNSVFAYRVFGGYAIPYGQSNSIPINARFYAGGSNDIRGWEYYSLGPGGLQLNQVVVNGGEIKLLAKMEYRQIFLKNFLAANWIYALFVDAGNVWYGPENNILDINGSNSLNQIAKQKATLNKGQFHFDTFYKQIGVGSGIGIRLDFNYLIVRFDFAFRIHDLERGWFNNKHAYFSFGIGHSF